MSEPKLPKEFGDLPPIDDTAGGFRMPTEQEMRDGLGPNFDPYRQSAAPSREAVEAVADAVAKEETGFPLDHLLPSQQVLLQRRAIRYLTAALPHLAPAPSLSDEERARKVWDDTAAGWEPDDLVCDIAQALASARAEATLAERRACADLCKGKRTALDAEAAIRARSS